MQKKDINRILCQIANKHNTTVSHVRKEIEAAMDLAQSSPDPAVRDRWNAIPRAGAEITVEEFIAYIITLTGN